MTLSNKTNVTKLDKWISYCYASDKVVEFFMNQTKCHTGMPLALYILDSNAIKVNYYFLPISFITIPFISKRSDL